MTPVRNKEIRQQIERADLRYWQVAEAIGITSTNFSLWLRQELTGSRLERVKKAIEELTAGGAEDECKDTEQC